MTVSVDEPRTYPVESIQPAARRHGRVWSHLTCGGDCEELHAFAKRLGLKREYAQHMDRPDHYFHHYDLVPSKRDKALALGAVFVSRRDQAEAHRTLRP